MKQVALITGASSGIGREMAAIHAGNGGDLVVIARRKEALAELKEEIEAKFNVKVYVIVKDLSRPDAAQEVYDELAAEQIEVEYLINNAGFGGLGKFHERHWSDDLQMINLNIVALAALTRLFLPDFVARNRGRILNVSSTASLMAGPLQATYYASKAFVKSFSNAIAEELHETDITVTALLPGATATGFGSRSGMEKTILFKQTASAASVAKAGYKGMMRGKLNVLAGVTLPMRIMLGMLKFTPQKIQLALVRMMQETE
jgi:short-subunit dehydrogenase